LFCVCIVVSEQQQQPQQQLFLLGFRNFLFVA
jgi:hypothetical protein